MPPEPGEVTQLLNALSAGDPEAMHELMPVVYAELRRLAHAQLRREPPDAPVRTTALVHEAFLRLVDQRRVDWANRAHFLAIASMAMRRVLVDHARARTRAKRGDGVSPLQLEAGPEPGVPAVALDLVLLDEALDGLDAVSPRCRQVVECRFFGGLTVDETAVALGCSSATVKRDWRAARAWLAKELERQR